MRFVASIITIFFVAACADNTLAPNTDVGLHVWADVSPESVSIRDSAAALRIRVYAANPSLHEIRVISGGPPYVFTGDPTTGRGLSGSFRIASGTNLLNAGPNTDWWGQPVYVFAPAQSEYDEQVVTLTQWVAGGRALVPGRYRVRSWFNGREGESAEFTLTP